MLLILLYATQSSAAWGNERICDFKIDDWKYEAFNILTARLAAWFTKNLKLKTPNICFNEIE